MDTGDVIAKRKARMLPSLSSLSSRAGASDARRRVPRPPRRCCLLLRLWTRRHGLMALGSVPRKRLRVSTPPAAAAPAAALVAAAPRQPRKNTLQHAGLRNLGNTCYLNAVLQVLLRCPRLQELLRQQATASSSADTLLSDLSSTLELMATQQSSHSPSSLLERLRMQHHVFRGGGQHDAQELLRCLLLSVHEAWAIQQPEACSEHGPRAAEHVGEHVGGRVGPSAAEQVFHGELEYTTRCLQCDERRTTREGFSDLSLSVHHEQPLEWGLAQFFEAVSSE